MAAIPNPTTEATRSETVEERFRRLEAVWTAETGYLSSYTDIVQHAAFQEIIRMGEAVVPLMLRDLEERPRLWVWALPEITAADPVPPGDGGNIAKMSEAWLRVGEGERLPMVEGIELAFPRLHAAGWLVSSPPDDRYNCIAWAANVTTDWWWPVGADKAYWPAGAPRELTLAAFREAFTTLGYAVCAGEALELGFQKIALFANDQGIPRHAARQLDTGRWTSKLGKLHDIEHALHDLEGTIYGSVVLIMKRPLLAAVPT